MPDLLFELGAEEIPARFLPAMEKDLQYLLSAEFVGRRILFENIEVKSTYRRLAVVARGIAEKQADLSSEMKGPPAKIAFDDKNNPTKAAQGFAAAQKVDVKSLIVRDNYIYAKVFEQGKPVKDIIQDIMLVILQKLHLPIAMRWGYETQLFVRPVHWILFLFNNEVIPFKFAGIEASGKTRGHRIFGVRSQKGWAGEIDIHSVDEYEKKLEEQLVIVDPEKRKRIIKKGIEDKSYSENIIPLLDNAELLSEVVYLTEYPVPVLADFPERFLEVPEEVLIMTMQKNQKYFPTRRKGSLTNKYFIVADGANDKNMRNVIEGNNRVLVARLEDARFFYEEDKKVSLDNLIPKLKSIVYHQQIGSVYQKMEKVLEIAKWLNKNIFGSQYQESMLEETVFLLKADLVTHMVYEFPELQGIMGRKYALHAGKAKEVAEAIVEHYLPRFADDELPRTALGVICSVADKIESIISCFKVDLVPTGSADPYALRRAALGIVNIFWDNKALEMDRLLFDAGSGLPDATINKVVEFLMQRVRTRLIDKGYPYDLVDAVLAIEKNNIMRIESRIKLLVDNKGQAGFKDVVDTAVRIKRISKAAHTELVSAKVLKEKEEKELYQKYLLIKEKNACSGDFAEIYTNLVLLIPYCTAFFDKILVMAEDKQLQENRLALLKNISDEYSRLADFEKIVI